MKSKSWSTSLLRKLLVTGLVLLIVHLVLQYLNHASNQTQGQIFELSNRFDVDDESSVPTWFAQLVLLGIGFAGLLAARLSAGKAVKRAWQMTGWLGFLLSIDEIAGLHEFILQTLHVMFFDPFSSSLLNNAWLIVMVPIGTLAIIFLYWLYSLFPRDTWMLLVTGIIVYLAGAVGMEFLASGASHRLSFLYEGIINGTEEGLELLGSITMLYAVTQYLESHHGRQLAELWGRVRPEK